MPIRENKKKEEDDEIDPYFVLGVAPNAPWNEIQKTYVKRCQSYNLDSREDRWFYERLQVAYLMLREMRDDAREESPSAILPSELIGAQGGDSQLVEPTSNTRESTGESSRLFPPIPGPAPSESGLVSDDSENLNRVQDALRRVKLKRAKAQLESQRKKLENFMGKLKDLSRDVSVTVDSNSIVPRLSGDSSIEFARFEPLEESREYRRVRIEGPVLITLPDSRHLIGELHDISLDGLCLYPEENLYVGNPCRVVIELTSGSRIEMSAEVVRIDEADGATGLKITKIEWEYLIELQQLIADLNERNDTESSE